MSKKSRTKQKFIEKSKEIHGDKYDYSLVEYINYRTKVIIICKNHGQFQQTPNSHLRNHGCSKCGFEKRTTTRDEFINQANKVHDFKYDYSLIECMFINTNNKVRIICKEHGIFEQIGSHHLKKMGCRKCSTEIRSNKQRYTTELFIEKANIIHQDKYDYSLVNYINKRTKVKIICNYHGTYEQVAGEHLRGNGCKNCSYLMNNGLNSRKIQGNKRTLYLIECWNENEGFYKIGITNKKISQRFRNLPYQFKILKEMTMNNDRCLILEKQLHSKYKKYRYYPKIKFSGHTESYILDTPIDILLK